MFGMMQIGLIDDRNIKDMKKVCNIPAQRNKGPLPADQAMFTVVEIYKAFMAFDFRP